MFAGLRHSELIQLAAAEIGERYLEVKGHKAKTRRRRLVTICPALRAWLDAAPPFRVGNLRKSFRRARLAAGTSRRRSTSSRNSPSRPVSGSRG
jgi:integrase